MKSILIAGICLVLPIGAAAQDAEWKAGVARAVITPEQPMWMVGYGNIDRVSKGKLDDLWVKALALQDPKGTRLLLLTADLVGIDKLLSDSICDQIGKSLGLGREAIIIATSHTHTGPAFWTEFAEMKKLPAEEYAKIDAYRQSLETKFTKVAQEAFATLAPTRVAWGNGSADFAVNRRLGAEQEFRLGVNAKGPVDHEIPVLRVSAPDGKLRAVVFGYACHNTAIGGASRWSGDYAGFAQIAVEKAHPGAAALFFSGCGGDQQPQPRGTVEFTAKHGRALADAVEQVLKSEMRPVSDRLAARFVILDLPYESPLTRKELEERLNSGNPLQRSRANLLLERMKEKGALSPTYPYPIQVWQLGSELTFVMLGGEPVVDYSLRLKREFGSERTWVAGYCNDVMAYIPSLRVLKEGGYEGKNSMFSYGHPSVWGSSIEELIVAKVHDLAGR